MEVQRGAKTTLEPATDRKIRQVMPGSFGSPAAVSPTGSSFRGDDMRSLGEACKGITGLTQYRTFAIREFPGFCEHAQQK